MSLKFDALQLDPAILRALQSAGYDSPTPVQAQAVPAALAGRDLMASAQTGSGKTAAFLLPALQKMIRRSDKPGKGPRVLVLTPTRELAMQVEKNAQLYAQNMKWLRSATLVGGAGFGFQIKALSRPIDLIVATPGRLMDHMRAGRIDFDRLEMLVLDEADRMLDMGFIDDIKTIVAATPDSRQTLLFSATWDGEVGKLARNLTKNPEVIEIERVDEQGKIEEQLLYCDDKNHKNRLLDHILRDANIDQCVIFTATKAMSEQLADELYEKGFAANCLHGDMPQGWRNRPLNDLRRGRCPNRPKTTSTASAAPAAPAAPASPSALPTPANTCWCTKSSAISAANCPKLPSPAWNPLANAAKPPRASPKAKAAGAKAVMPATTKATAATANPAAANPPTAPATAAAKRARANPSAAATAKPAGSLRSVAKLRS